MQQGTFFKGLCQDFGFEIIGGNIQTFFQRSEDVLRMQDRRLGKHKTKRQLFLQNSLVKVYNWDVLESSKHQVEIRIEIHQHFNSFL